jgi:ribose transport system substrate-binding protein
MIKTKFACVALMLLPIALSAVEPLKIAVIPKSKDNVYWQAVRAGALKAAADLKGEGTDVTILWDGTDREDQPDAQKAIVAGFVAQKVNGIVLAPLHPQALVGSVEQADAAKIPVVVIDSPLASQLPKATVATNNYKAGGLAARKLAEAIGAKGNVALFRYMKGHSSTLPRESGFLDGLKKYPGIHVVSSDLYAGATEQENATHAKELIEKTGADLQGVFASNLYATLGMIGPLRDAGKAGKVAFVGFDSNDVIIDAVRKGDMAGVAVQQPFMMGYLGVRTVVQVIQGKSVDHDIDTDVKMVTKENLDTPEVQQLLNPGK